MKSGFVTTPYSSPDGDNLRSGHCKYVQICYHPDGAVWLPLSPIISWSVSSCCAFHFGMQPWIHCKCCFFGFRGQCISHAMVANLAGHIPLMRNKQARIQHKWFVVDMHPEMYTSDLDDGSWAMDSVAQRTYNHHDFITTAWHWDYWQAMNTSGHSPYRHISITAACVLRTECLWTNHVTLRRIFTGSFFKLCDACCCRPTELSMVIAWRAFLQVATELQKSWCKSHQIIICSSRNVDWNCPIKTSAIFTSS